MVKDISDKKFQPLSYRVPFGRLAEQFLLPLETGGVDLLEYIASAVKQEGPAPRFLLLKDRLLVARRTVVRSESFYHGLGSR